MKNVFDYHISLKEWEQIRGGMTKETYLSIADNETKTADVAALFYIRGDLEKARDVSEGLPPEAINDLWRTLMHP